MSKRGDRPRQPGISATSAQGGLHEPLYRRPFPRRVVRRQAGLAPLFRVPDMSADRGPSSSKDSAAGPGGLAKVRRMGASLVALGIGLLMFVGAAVLLFWNEGDTARLAVTLQEGHGRIQAVEAAR